MDVTVNTAIGAIDAAAWDALAGDNPFLRHAFLHALEASGSVAANTGWSPRHLSISEQGRLIAALPLYLKDHSFGEYVFDWAWADAYARLGRDYYPKLVSMVPYSPVTGPRLLLAPDTHPSLREALIEAVDTLAEGEGASSAHVLYPPAMETPTWHRHGYLPRLGCQYHWRDRGYGDFEGYLARFRSASRKKVRRERRRVEEAGITHQVVSGAELDAHLLDAVYRFYASTYLERGRAPYLNREFFRRVCKAMGTQAVVFLARDKHENPVAAAFCLRGADTLYGRYWGSDAAYHSLHFETCYYQGIEYCLREGLTRFEPGTQGEHKVRRGFEPVETHSCHRLYDPRFETAVADFLTRERHGVRKQIQMLATHLPFREQEQA